MLNEGLFPFHYCCGASEPEASERSSRLICAVGSKKADFLFFNLALIEKHNIVPFTCCLVETDLWLKINTKLNIINLR
jgi:hypothetical protein